MRIVGMVLSVVLMLIDAEAARDLILKRRDRLAGADQGGV